MKRFFNFIDLWVSPFSLPLLAYHGVDAVKTLWPIDPFVAWLTGVAFIGMTLAILSDTLSAWAKRIGGEMQ